jgi:hypothetical protein
MDTLAARPDLMTQWCRLPPRTGNATAHEPG